MKFGTRWNLWPLIAALIVNSFAPISARACAPQDALQAATREVTDETGRRVHVPLEVRRIVSIAPNMTETIYALGAQDRLAGDTDYCDYPPEATQKPHVGGALNPSLEEIVALKPDLVLAAKTINRRETVLALERVGVAVYATDPHTVEGVIRSIENVADVIGAAEEGRILTANLQTRLDALKQRLSGVAPARALFVVWEQPFISIGPHSFIADALRYAGAQSVVRASQDWPQVSLEEVVRQNPDYLIFASNSPKKGEDDFTTLSSHAVWRDLPAVREKHFAVVSDAINRPGPRLLDAIEELARQLHPAAFAPNNETPKPNDEIQNSRINSGGPRISTTNSSSAATCS